MNISLFVFLFKLFELCCHSSRSFPLLESLDKYLCEILAEPSKFKGRELMEAMKLYNSSVNSLTKCVVKKEVTVAKAARDLRVQGGPLFLKQKLGKHRLELMKIDFKWTEQNIQEMLEIRSDTLKSWRHFYKLFRKHQEFYNNILTNYTQNL